MGRTTNTDRFKEDWIAVFSALAGVATDHERREDAAWEVAREGEVYVIGQHRDRESNLRTHLGRIAAKHYVQVTPDHWAKAVGGVISADPKASGAPNTESESPKTPCLMGPDDSEGKTPYPLPDSNERFRSEKTDVLGR